MYKNVQIDVKIYAKMFCILSFNWIFGLLTPLLPDNSEHTWVEKLQNIIVFLFVILTAANGVVICFIFTFNERIFGLYKRFLASKVPWIEITIVRPIKAWRRNRKISAQSQMSKTTITTQNSYISRGM